MGKKALKQLNEAVDYLKKKYKHQPEVGIVLGSGLGNFTEEIEIEKKLITAIYPIFRYQL
jgi:purine-nucleoside phosphorylase